MSTMTIIIDSPNGIDSNALFPGMYPHTSDFLTLTSPLGIKILRYEDGLAGPSTPYELVLYGSHFNPPVSRQGSVSGIEWLSAPAGLQQVPLAHATVTLDASVAGAGGTPIDNITDFTPDTVISNGRMLGPLNLFFVGNVGNDSLTGSYANDIFLGGAGADQLNGREGNDTASYASSNVGVKINLATGLAALGHATGDRLLSIESLVGSDFADALTGDAGNNVLNGRLGNDTIHGGLGDDKISGDGGEDLLYGDDGSDEIHGGDGNDRAYGGQGNDALLGEDGADRLYGDEGSDSLFGGAGDDRLYGGDGYDLLDGGSGNNILDGGAGKDSMTGGIGTDTMYVDDVGDTVFDSYAGDNDRVVTSVSYVLTAGTQIERMEFINAASTADINLTGNGASQAIRANAGDNVIDGGGGGDIMTGFGGDDRYFVDDVADRPVEAVGGGSDEVLASASYALKAGTEIERLATTDASGFLDLGLTGNEFGQTVEGNAGSNWLNGRAGSDTLLGGDGDDIFMFDTKLGVGNIDLILDFNVADDTIGLARSVFSGLGYTFSASRFVMGAEAQDANDRIIYNSSSGALLFDADGAGGAAAVKFAQLQAGLALTHNDFVIM